MKFPAKLPLIAVATLVVAGGAVAVAQPPGPGPGHHGGPFSMLAADTNGDGKLTRAEFDTFQKARFGELDANKDGKATPEEFRALRETKGKEIRADMEKAHFQTLDTNKDGQISQSEFAAGPDGKGPRSERGHHRHGRSHDGKDGPGMRRDANDDQTVSLTEFSARGIEAFNRADTNKDGVVTISELQALKPGRL